MTNCNPYFSRLILEKIKQTKPIGWMVRIFHKLTMDDDEGWKVLESAIDFGDRINLYNATELIKKLNLAYLFAMTWRWVSHSLKLKIIPERLPEITEFKIR